MTETSWSAAASWWQEEFTAGKDAEYEEQIIPLLRTRITGGGRVLDIGTGEGQLARAAVTAGAGPVIGVDPTAEQVSLARQRGGGVDYVRGSANALPFADGSFDTTVICLVLEHVREFGPAILEAGRVTAEGGRLLLFLNHPLLQAPESGWIDDHVLGEQYWRVGDYLSERETLEEVQKDVFVSFFHRPLHRYVNVLTQAGFAIETMEEPPPPPGFLKRAEEYRAARFIPRLLFLSAEKVRATRNASPNVSS